MKEKRVCFAGHRYSWYNVGIEDRLREVIENLILNGYTTFFNGDKGYFDKLAAQTVLELKNKFPHIKLVKILSNYNHKKADSVNSLWDETIYPDIEDFYPKQRITKRNQWMIENCDVLVCHIVEKYKSGAYNSYKYAKKLNKQIIEI